MNQQLAMPSGPNELGEYRSVSRLAVGAFCLALGSPLAWLHPLLWTVAWAAVIVAVVALVRLHSRPELTGQTLARSALVLALFSAVGTPTQTLVYRKMVALEARRFAETWFSLLQDGQPERAHQLKLAPSYRRTADVNLWEWYRQEAAQGKDLKHYINQPVQRSLLGLGRQAVVRHYDTLSVTSVTNEDLVVDRWVVTYADPGRGRCSYFVVTVASRRYDPKLGIGRWKLDSVLPVPGPEEPVDTNATALEPSGS